jgi:WG containing repeat
MKRTGCIFWLLLINFFSAASSYNVFEENGKVGLKNEQGKVLIPARYEALGWSDGTFTTLNNVTGYKDGDYWGLISLENRLITKAFYEEVFAGEGSLIIARKKSNLSLRTVTGCLNTSGKEILPFQYDGIKLYSLRAVVFTKIGNQYKYGLVDLENKTLIPQQYKNIHSIGSLRYAVENFENRMALYSDNGKQITPFNIDSISSFKKNFAIIYQDSQQGLIDRDGEIKAFPTYREIRIDDDGTVHTRQVDEWLFLDGQNKLFQKKQADSVVSIGKNMLHVTTAGRVRIENYELKPIYDSKFSSFGDFTKGKAIFSIDHKFGVAQKDGSILIPAKNDFLQFDKQFIISNQKIAGKEMWSVLDSSGNTLTSKSYDRIHPFNGKIFPVVNRNFWGAVDGVGKEIIACSYDSIVQQLNSNIVVKFRGQYGVINMREEWIVTPRPNKLKLITDDRFIEITPRTTYLKSIDGNVIYFSENKLDVSDEHIIEHLPSGSLWEIDLNGVIVNRQVHPEGSIEKIFPESEGLRAIKKNGQYGFVDSQGRLRIANRYDDIQSFKEDLAAIKIRGKWGFINHEDKIAIQPVYEEVTNFKKGFSLVKQKGLQGLIDKSGKQILPPRYENISVLDHGNLLIRQDKLFGLSDPQGKILINPKYHTLKDLNNNYVIVERDGKFGVISLQGISTIPLIYDYVMYDAYNNFFIALKKSEWVDLKL